MSQKKFIKQISSRGIMIFMLLFSVSLVAKVEIINHTDIFSKLAPGGSWESFKFSVDNNIDYDLDVQLSKDGELVLSHDSVSRYTWNQLKEMRIASANYSGKYADSKYIRLVDVLYYLKNNNSSIKVYIDVKNFSTRSNGAFQKTLNMVKHYGLFDNVYLWVRSIGQKNSAKGLTYGEKAHYALWVSYDANLAVEASSINNRDGIDVIGFRYRSSYDGGYSFEDIIAILHDRGIKVSMFAVPKNDYFINDNNTLDYISDSKPETLLDFSYFKNNEYIKNEVENSYEEELVIDDVQVQNNTEVESLKQVNSRRVELGNEKDMQTLFILDSSVTFFKNIENAGDYNLTFRVRSDYRENRFNNSYRIEIDGIEVNTFVGDLSSIEKDVSGVLGSDWYWGLYRGSNITLSEGIHHIKIIPSDLWSGVDSLFITK